MGRQVRKKTETYEMSLVYGVVTLVALLPWTLVHSIQETRQALQTSAGPLEMETSNDSVATLEGDASIVETRGLVLV